MDVGTHPAGRPPLVKDTSTTVRAAGESDDHSWLVEDDNWCIEPGGTAPVIWGTAESAGRSQGEASASISDVADATNGLTYVPAHPGQHGQQRTVRFELRATGGGERVCAAFSSRGRLVAALGAAQPWLALPVDTLRLIMAAAGIATIYLDPDVPAEAPRWGSADLERLAGARHG